MINVSETAGLLHIAIHGKSEILFDPKVDARNTCMRYIKSVPGIHV